MSQVGEAFFCYYVFRLRGKKQNFKAKKKTRMTLILDITMTTNQMIGIE